MKFVHMPQFAREAKKIFTATELDALEVWLAQHPHIGDIIPHSGGCRKVRWAIAGRGKRGGARVIYFLRLSATEIRLMRAYVKNEQSTLPSAELRRLKNEAKGFSNE